MQETLYKADNGKYREGYNGIDWTTAPTKTCKGCNSFSNCNTFGNRKTNIADKCGSYSKG